MRPRGGRLGGAVVSERRPPQMAPRRVRQRGDRQGEQVPMLAMVGRRMRQPPKEDAEQRMLASWLDLFGLQWLHVPNGGKRDPATAAELKRQGVKAGAPDVLIFDRPPNLRAVGTALELKRTRGGRVRESQRHWLAALEERGWHVVVARGADEAIAALRAAGYGARR